MTTTPHDNVATEWDAPQAPECPFCGSPITAQKVRRGRPKVYCDDHCRSRDYERRHPRQKDMLGTLFLPESGKRANRAQRILARLRQGPAKTFELMQVGGSGWRSRLQELRDGETDGTRHEIETECHGDYAVYTLRGS